MTNKNTRQIIYKKIYRVCESNTLLYHLKMLQRFPDGSFLLRRTLELLGVLGLLLVVVLPLLDAAFLLDLCNIEVAHVQTGVLLDVLPDFFISSLGLCSSHVQFIHFQVYRDLLVDI